MRLVSVRTDSGRRYVTGERTGERAESGPQRGRVSVDSVCYVLRLPAPDRVL